MVARYGGEEFIIILPETGEQGAVAFADRIRERVEQHKFEGQQDGPRTGDGFHWSVIVSGAACGER